ncbi:MAG: diguanylate cyclase [Syntrophales bacterium]|nr:diguanylate cyclase [Syntrophales bacterium]
MDPQKTKILIVDDDAFVREMLSQILESGDYRVVSAENGADALDQYHKDSGIDLIVSDMNMPGVNGLDLISSLRHAEQDVPIIILTATNKIKIAIEAMKMGANDYLIKDENIQDTILMSVERVMEQNRLKIQNLRLRADLEEKNKQLEQMAFLDGLTGIPNRRYFDDFSVQEWGRAIRGKIPFSVILFDIDFFKFYNDTYGHQQGDDCLKKVAGALKDTLERHADFVSRYGGEEFAVVLPNTDMSGACSVAEAMRSTVEALNLPHEKSQTADHVTVSGGIGSVVPREDSELSQLISKADRAMYTAKEKGRNRIVKAEP